MIAIQQGNQADNNARIAVITVILLVLAAGFIVVSNITGDASLTGLAILVPQPQVTQQHAAVPSPAAPSLAAPSPAPAGQAGMQTAASRHESLARVQALLDEQAPVPSLDTARATRRTAMPGELIVKLKGVGVSSDDIATIGASFGVRSSDELVIGGMRTAAASGIYRLRFSPDADMNAVLAAYLASPAVEWAELNYLYDASFTPNDPDYPSQWGLSSIDASGAWDTTQGSPTAIIAVVDSGVMLSHPDLAANIWTNPGEIPSNGIDDDLNGRVDDVSGWDFVTMDNDPSDAFGHGTHVAGIAAAAGNNGVGVSGVCPHCAIMPVRVLNSSGVGTSFDVAAGIYYAATNGARVILLSLAGTSDSMLVRSAVAYAVDRGAVVVAAAGNDDSSARNYPAAYDGVIAVAATADGSGARASYSNYNDFSSGIWIDVAAPGNDIESTQMGGGYTTMSGTSIAAAFVAGTAGLIISNTPTLSGKQAGDVIRSTTSPLQGTSYIGMGLLNANNAVGMPWAINASFDHARYDGAFLSGNVSINGTASGSGFVSFDTYRGPAGPPNIYPGAILPLAGNTTPSTDEYLIGIDTGHLPNGRHMISLAVNDGSHTTKDQLLVFVNNSAAVNDSSAINESMTLYDDVVAPHGISLVGGNITLNCNSHWIIGNGSGTGISVTNKRNVTIQNCNVADYDTGISVSGGANITIMTTAARDINVNGIYTSSLSNLTLWRIDMIDVGAQFGVNLHADSVSKLDDVQVSDADEGIYVDACSDTRIGTATTSNNSIVGVYVSDSTDTMVAGSTADGNDYGFFVEDSKNDILSNANTADSATDGITISHSVNSTLQQTAVNNASYDYYIWVANATTVNGASSDSSQHGFYVSDTKDTRLQSPRYQGADTLNAIPFTITQCINTTIRDTVIDAPYASSLNPAVAMQANRTVLSNLTITGWFYGVSASRSYNNTIANSTIGRSLIYGIAFGNSYNNLIYNNNLSNDANAYDDGTNFWNSTYRCMPATGVPNIVGGPCWGGNHWSDYDPVGLDAGGGSGIHATAGDMIGDTLLPWQSSDIATSGDLAPLYIRYNDTFPPTVTALQPVAGFNSTATILNFTWNGVGNDLNFSCNLSVDGVTLFSGLPLINDSAVTYPYGPFADGWHWWNATCADSAGNANASYPRYFVVDTAPPMIENLTEDPASPTVYDENRWYRFTSDAADATNGVLINYLVWDNMSAYGVKQEPSTWNVTIPPMPAGTHNYSWIAVDTLYQQNTTPTRQYIIDKAVPVLNITLSPSATITYNDTLTAGCAAMVGDDLHPLYLYLNDSLIASGGGAISLSFKPAAGTYTVNCTALETQNFTTTSQLATLVVNRATPIINISFDPNASVYYNTWTTAACSLVFGDSATSVTLARNGTTVASGVWTQSEYAHLGAGVWPYDCSADESDNFTSGTITGVELTVLRTTPYLTLGFMPTSPMVYGSEVQTTCTAMLGDPAAILETYWNGTLFGSGTSPLVYAAMHRAGVQLVDCPYPGSANYTTGDVNDYYTILRADSVVNLSINHHQENISLASGASSDIIANLTRGQGPVVIIVKAAIVANGSSPRMYTDVLGQGRTRVTGYYGGNENYTEDNVSYFVTMQPPEETHYRSSDETCNISFVCGDWGACAPNGTQTRTCTDQGNCRLQPRTERQGCVYNACVNGIADAGESDVDCGGACGKCADGRHCLSANDCATNYCDAVSGLCASPPQPEQPAPLASCSDSIQNQGEAGIDCGGPCMPCAAAPTCSDGIQNQGEGGVDCGGPCTACPPQPSCSDSIQNQGETGVDCGGPCAACATAKSSWLAVIPWLVVVLAIGAFAVMAVLRKKSVHGPATATPQRVATLLDTAESLLLEGRDDEAAQWYDQACNLHDQLTADQKGVVEAQMTRVKQQIEGGGKSDAKTDSAA